MITASVTHISKSEWRIWLPLAIVSFFGASLLMSGWPQGFKPEMITPFTYAGDGFAYLWNVQRVIEGAWYFDNARAGFPFGSNHLDYPTADTGSYLIIKLLGLLFHNASAATNLYFLLGFAVCAVATYVVVRSLGLSKLYAVACAIIYTFTSYHFGRIGHLFFTWYFVAPLFLYLGFRLISGRIVLTNSALTWSNKLLNVLGIISITSFGIYYDLYGCIVIFLCTMIAYVIHRSRQQIMEGMVTLSVVVLGLLANVMPSLLYIAENGESREGVNRYAQESELYGLKITQLLLPRGDHRLDVFADFTSRYNNHFPLVTENMSASMGLVGSLGFLLFVLMLLIYPFVRYSRAQQNASTQQEPMLLTLQVLAVLMLGMVLMGTVGGGASLFALLITSSFRAWNRISIFIAFVSVLGFFIAVELASAKLRITKHKTLQNLILVGILTLIGLYDQTVRPCHSCQAGNASLMKNDQVFFKKLESSLTAKSAIYQLPYMTYSDSPALNGLGSYDQARGHLHTQELRWSFGGVRGRVGDWFYRQLSTLPIEQQVVIAKSMGFSGIYLDRRGYLIDSTTNERCALLSKTKEERIKNSCMIITEVEREISNVIGDALAQKALISQDKQLIFFPFSADGKPPQNNTQHTNLANDYLAPIGFKLENGKPVQTEGGFDVPLDLRKENTHFPAYVGGVTGLSGVTIMNGVNMGRWSDAHTAKHVTIWLAKPLPKSFTLQVQAQAAGLNAGKPVKVKVGKQIKEIIFGADFSTQTLTFDLNETVHKIEFVPADPFSPARRWGGADTRVIAIHFAQIAITPK